MSVSLTSNLLPLLTNAQTATTTQAANTQTANTQSASANTIASEFASLLAYTLLNNANAQQLSNGLLSNNSGADTTATSTGYNALSGVSSNPLTSSSSSENLLWSLLSQAVNPLTTSSSTDTSSAASHLTTGQSANSFNQLAAASSIL